jgi:hypothetical protein
MSVDYVNKFSKILSIMKDFKLTLEKLPTTKISPEDLNTYNALVEEETTWYSDNINSDSRTYQEECMYIIQRLTATFTGKPLMTNQSIVQEHIKKQICAAS